MPITILDLILLGVMLISGILAMIRGFMREVLSIAAWAIAALATIYFFPRLLPSAKQYFANDLVANGVVIAGVFIGTLIVVSIITVKISDMVLDSRIGALDRTLGFLFGLGRGLLIVVVAFLFFAWLVPERGQPDWVKSAKSLTMLESTGKWLMSLLPEDPESTIFKTLRRQKGEERTELAPAPSSPGSSAAAGSAGSNAQAEPDAGYGRGERADLRRMIETKAVR